MSNSQGLSANAPFVPVLLLALLALGGYYLYDTPFDAWRPQAQELDISVAVGLEEVNARLWQDPLTAVDQHLAKKKEKGEPDSFEPDALMELATRIAAFEASPASDQEAKRDKVLVLPVMLRGGAYSEDVEQRRRRRYAVLSALGVAGFAPNDSEHIGYFTLPWSAPDSESKVSRLAPWLFEGSTNGSSGQAPDDTCATMDPFSGGESLVIPYEWLRREYISYMVPELYDPRKPAYDRVLVLWLNDNAFVNRPLTRLKLVRDALQCGMNQARVRGQSLRPMKIKVIGPATTTTLDEMLFEAKDWIGTEKTLSANGEAPIEIYSPAATASARLLLRDTDPEQIPGCLGYTREGTQVSDNRLSSSETLVKKFAAIGVKFFRTTVADNKLAEIILCDEFKRRRIRVYDPNDVVLLVAEWDSFYGRALPTTFETILWHERSVYTSMLPVDNTGERAKKDTPEDNEVPCQFGVCRYSYLRGLDGEVPEHEAEKPQAKSRQATVAAPPDPNSLEQHFGDMQFDYLRRLAREITEDVQEAGAEVKAVGILGSDVYDKLLILQALRKDLPWALFFTTDLDSRYVHPSQQQWTQNLIVASSFGLDPNSGHRLHVPPFRDSYQTAMFKAVEYALGKPLDQGSPYRPRKAKRVKIRPCENALLQHAQCSNNLEQCKAKIRSQCALFAQWDGRSNKQGMRALRRALNERLWPKLFEIGRDDLYALTIPGKLADANAVEASPTDAWTRILAALTEKPTVISKFEDWLWPPQIEQTDIAAYEQEQSEKEGERTDDDNNGNETSQREVMGETQGEKDLKAGQASSPGANNSYSPADFSQPSLVIDQIMRYLVVGLVACCGIMLVLSLWAIWRIEDLRAPLARVLIGLALFGLFALALRMASRQVEEPFAWLGGISVWPTEALRFVAAVLSVLLLFWSHYTLKRNAVKLSGRYVLQSAEFAFPGNGNLSLLRRCLFPFSQQVKSKDPRVEVRALWRSYLEAPTKISRRDLWRVVPPALLCAAILVAVDFWSDHVPARGNLAYFTDRVILAVSVGAYLLLLMYVVNATLLCRRFVLHLIRKPSQYPLWTQQTFTRLRELDDPQNDTQDPADFYDWLDVQLIAYRTRAVTSLIYGPFIVLLLFWISYSHFFDGWHRPPALFVIFLIPALVVVGCHIALRQAAEKGRRRALDRMDQKIYVALSATGSREKRLRLLQEDIKEVQEGAFRPMSQQPLLKALLLPFAGASGLLALEYFITA